MENTEMDWVRHRKPMRYSVANVPGRPVPPMLLSGPGHAAVPRGADYGGSQSRTAFPICYLSNQ